MVCQRRRGHAARRAIPATQHHRLRGGCAHPTPLPFSSSAGSAVHVRRPSLPASRHTVTTLGERHYPHL